MFWMCKLTQGFSDTVSFWRQNYLLPFIVSQQGTYPENMRFRAQSFDNKQKGNHYIFLPRITCKQWWPKAYFWYGQNNSRNPPPSPYQWLPGCRKHMSGEWMYWYWIGSPQKGKRMTVIIKYSFTCNLIQHTNLNQNKVATAYPVWFKLMEPIIWRSV